MRSLAVSRLLICEFLDRRSFQIRYAAFLSMVLAMQLNVLMFRLALSSHIYFLLFETPIVTLWSSWAPKHVLWQRVFRSASVFKVRNLIWWTGHFATYVCLLFGWRYISSLHSADELQQERNRSTVAILLYRFLSCWCRNVFHVVSALQSFAFIR